MAKIGLKMVVFILMIGAGVKLEKISKYKKRGSAPNWNDKQYFYSILLFNKLITGLTVKVLPTPHIPISSP